MLAVVFLSAHPLSLPARDGSKEPRLKPAEVVSASDVADCSVENSVAGMGT
jgi:hypothetical protein